ncbi:MAG TPA: hypothetical protein VGH10_08150 [Actinomycetota bacterium]
MTRRWCARLPVAFVAPALALAILASPAAASPAVGIWRVLEPLNPRAHTVSNTFFTGVSATSATDAWTVGIAMLSNAFQHPLVEHWDGQQWKGMRVPEPAGRQSWFQGVKALSPTNAWAVGVSSDPQFTNQDERTLIEHWDGTSWSIVPSPNPELGPGAADVLTAIDGLGPNDLWASGWTLDSGGSTIGMLFVHWDGTRWTAARSPTPPGGAQFAVAIHEFAADDAWAVGNDQGGFGGKTIAAHWDGHAWSDVETPGLNDGIAPQNFLTGVSGLSGDDVWVSGYEGNVDQRNFMKPYLLHWDGSSWTLMLAPNKGGEGSRLNATVALSSDDVWAVGQTQELNGSILTLTEQWDGTAWTIVPSPSPGQIGRLINSSLNSVTAPGGGYLLTTGARELPNQCCLRTLALDTTSG